MVETSLGARLNVLEESPRRLSRAYYMKMLNVAAHAAIGLFLVSGAQALGQERKELRSPVTLQILAQRKLQQQTAAKARSAFYGFEFTNRVQESNITFENRAVDDAGKNYKAAHYDHGTGIADFPDDLAFANANTPADIARFAALLDDAT